jgi:NitT/TauT family transport system substrate-binding protein
MSKGVSLLYGKQMNRATIALLAWLATLFAVPSVASAAQHLRLALQKTGTGNWEIHVAQAFGLDKEADLELQINELASPEASKIALLGGNTDLIISDWLWVARERANGVKVTFYPYSSGIGALMSKNSSINEIVDLKGKKVGVAGGPLDKSWLLLKAAALKKGIDLEKEATIIYAAPPLIAEKALQGEIDAVLEYWNFTIDLEAQGFRRVIDLTSIEKELGAKDKVIITGYVFNEEFAAKNPTTLQKFLIMTKKARELIETDDRAWNIVAKYLQNKTPTTLDLYRKSYSESSPKKSIAEEQADVAKIYSVLAEIGGEKLVGPTKTLDMNVFYKGPH